MRKLLPVIAIVLAVNVSAQITRPAAPMEQPVSFYPSYSFNPQAFNTPSLSFGPMTRWWWPGNSVDTTELKREINLFADNGFSGVEIQPLNRFIPGTAEARAKALTWDTPDYYANLIVVMKEAMKRKLIVDMTDGSGWPAGGPHLSVQDGFLTLDQAHIDIRGGGTVNLALPMVNSVTKISPRLVTVLAVRKMLKKQRDTSKTITLDPASTIVVTKFVNKDTLIWKAPAGNWTIIAFWSKLQGFQAFTASTSQGPVMNHFDSTKVLKNYNHLFGARTGLAPFFGKPMRAVFDDSYEFSIDRNYDLAFLELFKKNRGYDITPWLPSQMKKGYNFPIFSRPKGDYDFKFSDQDWRLRYDYDLTLSELIGEQFLNPARKWLESRGLLHRTQAYGFNMDMMAVAGLTSIPETESMLGPEANLKIMTSGGHLYNRPLISAESGVFANRAYTNSPQKIKIAVDKLFAAGVNQIIYHGFPYRYTPVELGSEGWYPFSRPNSANSYSSNIGEGNIFWNSQKSLNEYVTRIQYALRSGKPRADVLIYFPFMDLDGMPDNPEEIMTKGELPGIEGPLGPDLDVKNPAKEKWAEHVYPLINRLESSGLTWEWVNDQSIQSASITADGKIDIRGNIYQALVLADVTTMQLKTAEKIKRLATQGLNLVASGRLPNRQPSFLNWKGNDLKTGNAIVSALKSKTSVYIRNENQLDEWIVTLNRSVKFNGRYHFTRQVQRDMSDGSRVQFIWNKSDKWQTISCTLDQTFQASFWMNAEDGLIIKNSSPVVTYRLAPYSSVLLYASTQAVNLNTSNQVMGSDEFKSLLALDKWDLKADSTEIKSSGLFDWRNNDKLKYSSSNATYTTSFQWNTKESNAHYFLDMGKVYYTAEVYVNDKYAGKRIFAPYMLDITSLLKKGENKISILITPGQLNNFIQKAAMGDSKYRQFRNKENQLMAAGLLGPVLIRSDR